MLHVQPLDEQDLDAALRLSTQAGWNQLRADWQRMLRLWPQSCLAGWSDGQLVATATLASYGASVGWIGMVLVDAGCRGRGFGGAILDAVIELAQTQGVRSIGLDATDAGRPVYLKRGFQDVIGIQRWISGSRPGHELSAGPAAACAADAVDWAELAAWDAEACGVDRSALWRQLAGESEAHVAMSRQGKTLSAFALARPGRHAAFIGPLAARTPESAAVVLNELMRKSPPQTAFMVDVPSGSALEPFLLQSGFQVQRRLMRMVRGADAGSRMPLAGHEVWTGAGLELG